MAPRYELEHTGTLNLYRARKKQKPKGPNILAALLLLFLALIIFNALMG